MHVVDKVIAGGLGVGNVISESPQTRNSKRPLISILKGTKYLIQSKVEKVSCEDFADISCFFELAFNEGKSTKVRGHKKSLTMRYATFDSSRQHIDKQLSKTPRRKLVESSSLETCETTSDHSSIFQQQISKLGRQRSPQYLKQLCNPVLKRSTVSSRLKHALFSTIQDYSNKENNGLPSNRSEQALNDTYKKRLSSTNSSQVDLNLGAGRGRGKNRRPYIKPSENLSLRHAIQ